MVSKHYQPQVCRDVSLRWSVTICALYISSHGWKNFSGFVQTVKCLLYWYQDNQGNEGAIGWVESVCCCFEAEEWNVKLNFKVNMSEKSLRYSESRKVSAFWGHAQQEVAGVRTASCVSIHHIDDVEMCRRVACVSATPFVPPCFQSLCWAKLQPSSWL